MGEVYLGELAAAGDVRRLVAVKLLLETGDASPQASALLDEARLTALLCHPNIVQTLDAGIESGVPWFAMEFVPGLSLFEILGNGAGALPPWIAARVVADACAALHAIHEARDERGAALEIVHRDVTPHNLLVSWDGIVKLTDLGLARSALSGNVTRSGVVRGKVGYLSPEQAAGAPADRRSDIFALGVILWEALAGRRLFGGASDPERFASVMRGEIPNLTAVASEVPQPLADVVARALARQPGARFATALDMQRELEAALSHSGLVVGATDVARFLAGLVPDRVREHERWLREPETSARTSATRDSAGALAAQPSRRSASGKPGMSWLVAGALLGAGGVIAALTIAGKPLRDTPPPPPAITAPPAAVAVPAPAPDPPTQTEAPSTVATRPARRAAARRTAESSPEAVARPGTGATTVEDGSLNVSASPTWATIRVDGRVVGQTPIVISPIKAGPHLVEAFPLGAGPPLRRTVNVEPAITTKIEFLPGAGPSASGELP
jgi:eukaryotic-like serine/threonine-protein kinase